MKGYFIIFKGRDGQVYFNLRSGNHEVILRSSEGYQSKDGALNGIESVQDNCTADSNYVKDVAKDGSPFFILRAGNYKTIGVSEMYSSRQAMLNGLDSVKRNGVSRTIKGLNEDVFEIFINKKSYVTESKEVTGADILKIGNFAGRFCVFLIVDGVRKEVALNQTVRITSCLEFAVVRND